MTRMNYGLNHARNLTVRRVSESDFQSAAQARVGKKKGAWSAKYQGSCANCHGFIQVGNLVTWNKQRKIVHGAGCPRKGTLATI